jgi:general secretion pathway protein C
MPQVSLDRFQLPQTALVALASVIAVALLGFVAAYWTWAWLAPRPEPRALAAGTSGGLASADALFGSVQRDRTSGAPAAIAIRLLGVVAAAGRWHGYAVVQGETRQILVVREGEEVAPGIRLTQVAGDHVILERSGILEKLAWPEKGTAMEPAALQANK